MNICLCCFFVSGITVERNLQNMNDEKNMTSTQKAQPKDWKKILKIIGNVFLWLFVAFALVVTILAFAAQRNSDGIPSVGGRSYLTVQSESMSPLINKGDLIIVRKISFY